MVTFSSPEPKAHWWAYRISRPPSSVVCRPHSLNIFSSETTGPIKVKFHMEPPWEFVQTVQITWPRWPPCPLMVKTLRNLLLRNQKADDNGSWYAASGARVLPSLFKLWPWVDQDLFSPLFLKLATNEWSEETFLLTSKLCPLGAVCPCPRAIYMYKIMKKNV